MKKEHLTWVGVGGENSTRKERERLQTTVTARNQCLHSYKHKIVDCRFN